MSGDEAVKSQAILKRRDRDYLMAQRKTEFERKMSEAKDLLERVSLEADELTITFDPTLSSEQIKATLTALADYYRACGGVGLPAEFAKCPMASPSSEQHT